MIAVQVPAMQEAERRHRSRLGGGARRWRLEGISTLHCGGQIMAGGSGTSTAAARGGWRLVIYRSAGRAIARVERGRRSPRVVVAQATYAGYRDDVGQYLLEQQMVQKWGMSVQPTKYIGYFVSHKGQLVTFSPYGSSCLYLVPQNALALVHHWTRRSRKLRLTRQAQDTDHQVYARTQSPRTVGMPATVVSPTMGSN